MTSVIYYFFTFRASLQNKTALIASAMSAALYFPHSGGVRGGGLLHHHLFPVQNVQTFLSLHHLLSVQVVDTLLSSLGLHGLDTSRN